MRCAVPFCGNDSSKTSQEISYFMFPSDPSLVAAWRAALRPVGWRGPERGAVCSQHFFSEDWSVSGGGERELRAGAVPRVDVREQPSESSESSDCYTASCDMKVCRICFATERQLYLLMEYKTLYKAYETLTGLLLAGEDNLPPYLCTECACQLLTCARFRTKSLRAHLALLEIIRNQDCITLESVVRYRRTLGDEEQLPDMDRLKNEPRADGPGLWEDIPIGSIKVELEDVTDERLLVAGAMSGSSWPGYSVLDVVKVENNNVIDLGGDVNVDVERIHGEVVSTQDVKHELSSLEAQEEEEPGDEGEGRHARQLLEGDQVLSCDICQYETRRVDQLMIHLKVHVASISYCCDLCPYKTVNKSSLIAHIAVHSDRRPFACDRCDRAFKTKYNLQVHQRIHSGERPFACDVCGRAYRDRGSLRKHRIAHSADERHSCAVCGKRFIRKVHLQTHLRTHSGDKPFSCHVCNKSFSQKGHRQQHMLIHSGEKPHSCSICKKAFSLKSTLQKHLRTHSSEKSHSCRICDKAFTLKSTLQKHLHTHSSEKRHACDVSERTFGKIASLQKHLRTHSAEKRYSCGFCSNTYMRECNLKKHLRTHQSRATAYD